MRLDSFILFVVAALLDSCVAQMVTEPSNERGSSGSQVGCCFCSFVLRIKWVLSDTVRFTCLCVCLSVILQGVPAPQGPLTSALASLRHTFVVADATLPDCPLIYASEG